jgi:hypothetical protein
MRNNIIVWQTQTAEVYLSTMTEDYCPTTSCFLADHQGAAVQQNGGSCF